MGYDDSVEIPAENLVESVAQGSWVTDEKPEETAGAEPLPHVVQPKERNRPPGASTDVEAQVRQDETGTSADTRDLPPACARCRTADDRTGRSLRTHCFSYDSRERSLRPKTLGSALVVWTPSKVSLPSCLKDNWTGLHSPARRPPITAQQRRESVANSSPRRQKYPPHAQPCRRTMRTSWSAQTHRTDSRIARGHSCRAAGARSRARFVTQGCFRRPDV